ncbi:MAG: UDP-N-acetylglucosamine 2-epimerase (non-hydrolyzing) [Nitrospirae bacterium CG08_land_8_20_14_0_20_52_24]|nr:MAG: UDP-N-acetylglucosamine 2-epimerase (non-hydrolyzing) [Nitrospirae bacterium CG08_land_8_20_14_0_20_52_24]
MNILSIIGARPQFIKAAVVSRAIAEHNSLSSGMHVEEVIVHTGQHYDTNMSEVFFEQMQIPKPKYNLGIGGGTHGAMTGSMLEKIEKVIFEEKPDAVIVYGDTNSTLAGALSAVKLHIPVGHVEAGLRSFNMRMPEEINRVLTDRISRWLFCPTETAVRNLAKEGIPPDKKTDEYMVRNVGDVMYDSALFYRKIAKPSAMIAGLIDQLRGAYYVATVHRAENTDDLERLDNIIGALDEISRETPVVLPLHPRTRKLLNNNSRTPRYVHLLEPVSYFDMIELLTHCRGVFTDSGGMQKEAYFFAKPCATLRDETEWVELLESGFNVLTGADRDKILDAEKGMCMQRTSCDSGSLFGNGDAGRKIVQGLLCESG